MVKRALIILLLQWTHWYRIIEHCIKLNIFTCDNIYSCTYFNTSLSNYAVAFTIYMRLNFRTFDDNIILLHTLFVQHVTVLTKRLRLPTKARHLNHMSLSRDIMWRQKNKKKKEQKKNRIVYMNISATVIFENSRWIALIITTVQQTHI